MKRVFRHPKCGLETRGLKKNLRPRFRLSVDADCRERLVWIDAVAQVVHE